MAKIICVANQKGGVGKSTLAFNLAYAFQNGLSVGLVDTDLQGSLKSLLLMMKGIELIPFPDNLESLRDNSKDLLIVDTPPYLSVELPRLFQFSDFTLIPTKASFFDVMAVKETIGLLKNASIQNIATSAGIVLNMVSPKSNIVEQMTNLLKEHDVPILETKISNRLSYIRSLIQGSVINGKDKKAKGEIIALANEVINLL